MKKTCSAIFFLSALSLFAFHPLQGTTPQTTTKNEPKERVVIEKKLTKKEIKSQQQERKKTAEKNKAFATKMSKGGSSNLLQKSWGAQQTYNTRPLYRVKSIGATGKTLTFDNETIWEVSNSSYNTIRSWTPGAYVVIIPNTSWFSSHTYRIENTYDHSSITANLSEGPFMKYAIFISFIDRMTNTVGLTDNSIWAISSNSRDSKLFNSWQNGQAILIGENRGWFGWPNGNILININENEYISSHRSR